MATCSDISCLTLSGDRQGQREVAQVSFEADEEVLEVDNVLFLCRYGSHLYGTDTPSSDLDLKAVFVEDLDHILFGNDRETLNVSTGGDTSRNSSEDVDIEFVELRKFLKDAIDGQTYAVELLFCDEDNLLYSSPTWARIVDNRDRVITQNVKPFIGYCVSQARKYGTKGERLRELEEIKEALAPCVESDSKRDLEECLGKGLLSHIDDFEYVKFVEQEIRGQDKPATLFQVGEKKYNLRDNAGKVFDSINGQIDKYGARSHRAKDGVDWKAVSHAYRCIFELKELLETGQITFPIRRREFVRKVKEGELSYDRAQRELSSLIDEVEGIDSELPEKADRNFWERLILETYYDMFEVMRNASNGS